MVAPYAGAWIEIKSVCCFSSTATVAPYAGAWIEIGMVLNNRFADKVAPYAGAWIEITSNPPVDVHRMSHPTRVRGLKYHLT